jgi:hypothetical protein
MALSLLLQGNHVGQMQLLALQAPAGQGAPAGASEFLMPQVVRLLQDSTRGPASTALPLCYSVLRLLVSWCDGCTAAVSVLLTSPSHLQLLVDLASRRVAVGDVHTAGQEPCCVSSLLLLTVLSMAGICGMFWLAQVFRLCFAVTRV